MSTQQLNAKDLTHRQRERLIDMYVRLLDEGRLDEIDDILQIAQSDSKLSEMIADINEGMADEAGFTDSPKDRAYAEESLQKVLDRFSGDSDHRGSDGDEDDGNSDGDGRASAGPQAAAESGLTLVELAHEKTGKRPSKIAEELNTSVGFLDGINNYPDQTPRSVRQHLVELHRERFGIPEEETWAAFKNRPNERMAASRDKSYEHQTPTFEEVIARSRMTDDQKNYWRKIARQNR